MPSDIGSSSYSEAAASNNAATPNGWPEGQNPSTVNDCARENMAASKRWYNKINPVLTTGGTSTAYTLTSTTQAETAYYNGQLYSFAINATCGASPSLNIDGLGAISLRKFSGGSFVALAAGDLQANQNVTVRYNSAAPGFDVLAVSGPTDPPSLSGNNTFTGTNTFSGPVAGAVPTGATMGFRGATSQVPSGWVLERGNSIGDASSGATERANADTVSLFTLLWANTNYVLQNSAGAPVSRGANAAADYAAHCRLVLPNMTNKFRRTDNSGTAISASGGSDTHTHNVSGSGSGNTSTESADGSFGSGPFGGAGAPHFHSVSIGITGSADAQNNIPAYVTELSIVKL